MTGAMPVWTMALSIVLICSVILVLVYVPGAQPSAEALNCDSQGGYWSSAEGTCNKTDSPAAGLAS
ncbi:MAG: hypothetical protein AAFN27_01450 [Pseudomonadota bacterium]